MTYQIAFTFACPPKVELYRRQACPPELQHRWELSHFSFEHSQNSALRNPQLDGPTFLGMTPQLKFDDM
jgi:hypothetical protein